MKYIVMRGFDSMPGVADCKYKISDIVEIESEYHMRGYAYRKFLNMGASDKTMKDDVYGFIKEIRLDDGELITNAQVYSHTNTFLIFIPFDSMVFHETK